MKKHLAILAAAITMISCGGEAESKQEETPKVIVEKGRSPDPT